MSWIIRRYLAPTEDKPAPASSTTTAPSPSPPTPTGTTTTPVENNNTDTLTQQIQQNQQSKPQQSPAPPTPKTPSLLPNNAKLLIGGLVFFSFSTLITRRMLIRKHLSTVPRYYTSSVYNKTNVNGAMDAFEALNIATINTVSVAMIVAGGTLCALDIDSVEGARARVRAKLGYTDEGMVPPTKEEEEQFERDIEEWLANVLDKKDLKEVRRKVEEAKAKQAQDGDKEGR